MENILDNHVEAYQGLSIYDFDNIIQLNIRIGESHCSTELRATCGIK